MGIDAQPRPLASKPSEAFSAPHGHVVVDVPGITITASSGFEFRPSELLNAAERAAADDGHEVGAVVQFRQASAVEEQFVLLTLKGFATLLRDRLEARS